MTGLTQQCPDGFKQINRTVSLLHTCGRPDGLRDGCVSTTFPVHGIEYSCVCGRIVHQVGLILVKAALTVTTWLVSASHTDFQDNTSGHL